MREAARTAFDTRQLAGDAYRCNGPAAATSQSGRADLAKVLAFDTSTALPVAFPPCGKVGWRHHAGFRRTGTLVAVSVAERLAPLIPLNSTQGEKAR